MRFSMLLTLLAGAVLFGQIVNPDEWPILHNIGHTNYSPTTKLKPPLKVKWMAKVPGKFWASPVIAEGKVVLQDENGYVFCLDAGTGELIWRYFSFGQPGLCSAPSIFNHKVYSQSPTFGDNANGMCCFDLATGDLLWQKPSGLPSAWPPCSPQVSGNRLFYISNVNANGGSYPGPRKCQVQCWNAETGDSLWTYTLCDTSTTNTSLLVAGDTVFASTDGQTVALAPEGRLLWSTHQHYVGGQYAGQLEYRSGELWMKTSSTCYACRDSIAILNASDGTWKRGVQCLMGSKQFTFMGDSYYSRTSGSPPSAFNISTGLLSGPEYLVFAGSLFGSGCEAVAAANGFLYIGFGNTADSSKPGNMWYAWDAATGNPVWSYQCGTNNCPSPVIAYDKLYTVSGSDGLVYCFENAQ